MGEVRCNCGHVIEGPSPEHESTTGKCKRCGCMRGDVLPLPTERLTFGVHRIRDIDAVTAPAWSNRGPTLEQRRRAIDRVLRRE